MTVIIDRINPPVSYQDVSDVETSLNVTLPDEYRDFIINHDGAGLEPNHFMHDGISYGLNSFIKLIDIPFQKKLLEEFNDDDLIPFALDGSGNYFCFNKRSKMASVYFVDHEVPGLSAVRNIANSFGELLKSLQPFQEKEVKISQKQVISSWVNPKLRDKLSRS